MYFFNLISSCPKNAYASYNSDFDSDGIIEPSIYLHEPEVEEIDATSTSSA